MANYNVGNIEVGVISNSGSAYTQLSKIEKKIKQIQIAQKSQSKVAVQTAKETESAYVQVATAYSNLKKSFTSLINFNYLYVALNYLKRFASQIAKLTTYASQYTETLNKFQVSFGDLAESNLEYINKLSRAYGLSRLTLMEYTATFNNMLKSLGNLDSGLTSDLSQKLVRMAIDYSSLFNQSIESTMKAFQSALAGSVRPIRSASGFDISETTIYSIYQELGGDKTMRQLNQLEKRLLRIIAIQRQLEATGAEYDWSRTINTFANQLKIAQEQIVEFGSTWGKLLLYYLKPALYTFNGIIMSVNEIGNALMDVMSIDEEIDWTKEFAGMEKQVDDVSDAVEELNSNLSLLGLDELNVLGPNSTSNIMGIDPNILKELKEEYGEFFSEVESEATKVSRKFMEWAGFTYDAEGNLVNVAERVQEIKDAVLMVSNIITPIIGFFIGGELIAKIGGIVKAIGPIGKALTTAFSGPIGWIIAAVALIGAGIYDIITNNKEQTDLWLASLSMTWENTLKPAIGSLLTSLSSIWSILTVLWDTVILPVVTILGDFFVYTLIPLLGSALNIIGTILNLVMPLVDLLVSVAGPIVSLLITNLGNVVEIFERILQFVLFIVDGIMNLIGQLAEPLIDLVNWIIDQMNALGKSIPDWLGGGWEIAKIEKISFDDLTAKMDTSSFANDTTASNAISDQSQSDIAIANAILESNDRVVSAIKNKDTNVNLNGKKVSEAIFDDLNDVSMRKGIV